MKSTALVLTSLLALSSVASADTKSWTALKGKFPTATNMVISIDVNAVAKTKAYATLVQTFLTEEQDAKQAFDMVKVTCGIDITTSISDLTVFGSVDHDEDFAIAVGLNGIDQAKTTDCLQKMMDQMSGKGAGAVKVTTKTKGKVTEYNATGESKKLYLAWIAKDVIVVAPKHIDEKGALEKVLAGKAPKGDFKTMLGKVNKAAPAFGVVAVTETEDGITFNGGFGDVTMASSAFSVGLHLLTSKAEEAATFVVKAQEAVKEGVTKLQSSKQPDLAKALGATTFSASGTEVTISGSITEAVLLKVLPDLDKIL